MPKKIFLLFFLLGGLTVFSLFAPDRLLGKNTLVATIVVSRAEEKLAVIAWSLADKVKEGQTLLKQSPPLQYTKKTVGKKTEILRQEVALAVLDAETGQVFEKRYWLETSDIKRANAIRRHYGENPDNLPRFQPEKTDEEFSVVTNWWNNFNSDLSMVKNGSAKEQYLIVANKFLMQNDNLVYQEDRTGEKYSDIVYTPYSKALRDKTLMTAGKTFIDYWIKEAFAELKQAGVMSKTFPDKLVSETMTEAFVKNIFLTEQTDPKLMLLSGDGGLEQAERVLIRLGANQEKTFRYTVSKTGASGLGQIMPKTYSNPKKKNGVVEQYALANLIKNIDIGRVDIKNGVKASILVLDDHLANVKNRAYTKGKTARKVFDNLTLDKLEEARGMAYNGGPGKYNTVTGGLNLKSRGAKETAGFLQKFRMIRDLKLFN